MNIDNNITNDFKVSNNLNNIFTNSNTVKTFSDCISKALDNAANYVIKSMPVTDHVRDVLVDVKNSFKSKDLREILSAAVKSSVREGLEILGIDGKNVENIFDVNKIAKAGGLVPALKNVVEIAGNIFTKNNIVGDYVYKFFGGLSKYIQSSDFIQKVGGVIKRLLNRKDKFMENVNGWYKAYAESNEADLKFFTDEIKSSKDIIKKFEDCNKQSKIIDNITKASKTQKLSDEQLQLCMQV